ncbi:MAG TPA: ferritin-like domain-containing protein, partial [Candidatus Xenobia bacterium]
MTVQARYQGQDLGAGGGLLIAVGRLLERLQEGEVLELESEHPTVEADLQAWCRRSGHRLLRVRSVGSVRYLDIARGFVQRTLSDAPETGVCMPRRGNTLDVRDWRVGRHGHVTEVAAQSGALAPRGAPVEGGAPGVLFSLRRRQDVWADEVAELYEQAVASQWQASTDIPWHALQPLDPEVELATCQIMTFLAESEYAALYVPARYIGQIHPHYTEVVLFLTTVMADEARHIEVFTKRALANGGGLGIAGATTQKSLATLLQPMDFSIASFLLSVLGEGTFLDLLAFLERHAPDPATRELLQRARRDEARHVHFGI